MERDEQRDEAINTITAIPPHIPYLRHWPVGAIRYPSSHIPRWDGQMEHPGPLYRVDQGPDPGSHARNPGIPARSTPSISRYKYLYTRARAREGRD